MMQCPQCRRTYAEDFSFCLDDGTRLVDPRALEKTLILPTPQQAAPTEVMPPQQTLPHRTPAPATAVASAPGPTQASSRSSIVKIILVIVGLIVVVTVWGVIKLGLWWLEQNKHSATQNTNAAPIVVTETASPSPSPSPSVDLLNLVRPQASPGAVTDKPPGSSIPPGTYQCQLTHGLGDFAKAGASFKLRITLNPDGTYFEQGSISIPDAGFKDKLAMEEKGRYSQSGDTLILSDRLRREMILGDSSSWSVPTDGSELRQKLRVSASGFQIYDDEEKQWFTFTRL